MDHHYLLEMQDKGESEIRRFILEKDLLETIIMLPDRLFFNTGIT